MSEHELHYIFISTGPVRFSINEENWKLEIYYQNHDYTKEIKFPTLTQLKKFFPLIDNNLAYMMASHHFNEIELGQSPLETAQIKIVDLTAI